MLIIHPYHSVQESEEKCWHVTTCSVGPPHLAFFAPYSLFLLTEILSLKDMLKFILIDNLLSPPPPSPTTPQLNGWSPVMLNLVVCPALANDMLADMMQVKA